MSLVDLIDALRETISLQLGRVLFSVAAIIVGLALYKVVAREIGSLKRQRRLDEHVAYTLTRIVQWIVILAVSSAIFVEFGVTIGVISGLFTVLGGTILGFAAINTIGNAIAGLIVMTSRPFHVGDRILFNGQFADVESIELIYTKLRTLDNVLVSIPNQELLKDEIDNFGKENVIRRQVTVTPGFEYDSRDVEAALLEAAEKVPRVLKDPTPYVWITDFQSYAVEYTLYAFIDEAKALPETDAKLHKQVLETCKEHKIDISTPLLLKQVQD